MFNDPTVEMAKMAKARRFSSIIGTSGRGFETPRVQKHFFLSNHEEYFTLSGENKDIVSNIPTMKYWQISIEDGIKYLVSWAQKADFEPS
jgi:hypothetical protein